MEAKTFKMYRTADISATHDSSQVNPSDEAQFEGVVFSDGKVAVRWLTAKRSVSVWDSMEDLLAIHGHPEYGSKLVWDAEISFKTGYEEGWNDNKPYLPDANEPWDTEKTIFEDGRKVGIKEVVEFANQFSGIKHNPEWQAKLKDWGINES